MRLFGHEPMPGAPTGADVLIIGKRTVSLPGLPSLRISGWLAPASLNRNAGETIQWFQNGVCFADEAAAPSMPRLCGVIALSDGFFSPGRATTLFHQPVQSIVEEWLRTWILDELRRRHDPGAFLRGCLNGPGLDLAVRDQAWSDLVQRHCPFPTTQGEMTLEGILQAQGEKREVPEVPALSIWDSPLASSGEFNDDQPFSGKTGSAALPPPDGPGSVVTALLKDLQIRQTVEAVAEERGFKILYGDQRSYFRNPSTGPSRADHDHLEDLCLTAFKKCGWPLVKVEVSTAPGFTEDARIYRSSPKFRSNWLETALLRLRADSLLCELLMKMKEATLIESRAPLSVFYDATQWCTNSLGDLTSPIRREFWPTAHARLQHFGGYSESEADRLRQKMLQAARDAYNGKIIRHL